MTITTSNAAGNARLNAYLNALSTAAGVSVNGQTAGGGLLVIGTSSLSGTTGVLSTNTLTTNPPFAVAGKVATLAGVPLTTTPSANGTAALAELRDSAGNTVASGLTVGTAGSGPGGSNPDIVVSTTTFVTSVTLTINSGTISTQ
jgi:hypothetical protein